MGNYRYLAKNMALLTISQFGTKILTFFLVPLYTSKLTTDEYGIYEIINTSVAILIPILTLNIMVAVLRYTLDKESDDSAVFSVGIKYLLWGTAIVAITLIINYYTNTIPLLKTYALPCFLMFVFQSASEVVSNFARAKEHMSSVAIAGVLGTLCVICGNVVFLCLLPIGLSGYFIAHIMGSVIQVGYLFVKVKAWRYIDFRKKNPKLQRSMVKYSAPMIVNTLSWHINNTASRYVVIWFCGMSENGIYSVASKIPAILNVVQTIFNQVWTLSAVQSFDAEDKTGFFSRIYSIYNSIMVLTCAMIILFNKVLAKILFAKDFFVAWKYVPFLTIAIVFGAVAGYVEGIFAAQKKTITCAVSTLIGAIINIILNISLVYLWGPIGAAVATTISYWLIYFIRIFNLKKYTRIRIHIIRDNIAYLILLLQAVLYLVIQQNVALLYGLQAILILVIVVIYKTEISWSVNLIVKKANAFLHKNH